jgi:hypothetical protein
MNQIINVVTTINTSNTINSTTNNTNKNVKIIDNKTDIKFAQADNTNALPSLQVISDINGSKLFSAPASTS